MNITDNWSIFRSASFGENIREVVETEECKVLRIDDATGEGTMTMYHVFNGVILMFNDFHMRTCYSRFSTPDNLFCIDHCREGRIEHRTETGMLYYMEAGDMRVDRRVHHSGNMDFPLSHYHGITIGMLIDEAESAIRDAMPAISVNLWKLSEKFSNDDYPFVLRNDAAVEHIFGELYMVPSGVRMDYFKIKVIELLIYLGGLELSEHKDARPYFYSGQIEKIKAIHRLLTGDLTQTPTAENLSERFDISVSALKTGFKNVYGSPISTYMRTYRMNLAASMLVKDRKLKIVDAAAMVGYDNQSKFAAAFKDVIGVSPMQYRSNRRNDFEE